jgi:biopolymer transport protein ExbD
MKLRHLITIISLLSFLLGGCSKQSAPPSDPSAPSVPSPEAPVLKVAVLADGRLTVDDAAATIESLQASLRTLSEKHGVVWYYREAGQQAPPPIALAVMKAVADAKLPIQLSSRPDYSDVIGAGGRPTAK